VAETVLAKLAVEITAKTTQFGKALSQQERALKGFEKSVTTASNQLKGAAAIFGVALGAKVVTDFTFEIAKLAGEAEGVRAAFERLPDSTRLMNDLKNATSGTVSELDLMKRTVQASNFGIALESLPELLKFAAIRAQQTGQSVDYLVDSIITGIGRKSPLILDNLGISAVRLKEQFNGASLEAQNIGDVAKAVGRIATEELQKMGDFSDNTSSKVQRLSATWENFKVTLGNVVNQSGILQGSLNFLTDILGGNSDPFSSLEVGLQILNNSGIAGKEYADALKLVQQNAELAGVKLIKLTDAATGLSKVVIDPRSLIKVIDEGEAQKQVTTLASLQAKVKDLNDQFTNDTDINDKRKLQNIGNEIIAVTAQIAKLEQLRKKQEEVNNQSLSTFGQSQLKQAESGEFDPFGGIKKIALPEQDDRVGDGTSPFLQFLPDQNLINERVDSYVQGLKQMTDAQVAAGAAGVQSFDQMRLAGELQREEQERQQQAAYDFGQIIGSTLGSAIGDQENFSKKMKQITKDLVATFLARALAAAISTSFSSSGNPIIGAALAGVASGVVLALFSGIDGGSGGGAKSSSIPKPPTSQSNGGLRSQISNEQVILINGEFKARGNDLVYVFDKVNKERQRTANG